MKTILFVVLLILIEVDAFKMTNKKRKQILKEANVNRHQTAQGSIYEAGGVKSEMPVASNMYKLGYSLGLEKKALKKAKKCNSDLPLGYNYFVKDTTIDYTVALPEFTTPVHYALFDWAVMFYDAQTTYTDEKTGKVIFKAQSLQWNETSKYALPNATIEFNRSKYPFIVCAYNKKIVFGKNVYKKGDKLKCPKNSKPNKKTQLCEIKGMKAIQK
ncbi:hypothetical protein M3Y97_00950900 [Aphelenchoides bicaudatus]|nr:hypothetical protein M3Y97_00950900 [Aphelenchoides bicaudatus]